MRSRMDPAGEEILPSHRRTKKGQPLCDCRFGLGRDLKLQRLTRALQHNTPPLAHAMRIPNIADLQADEIAGRQFAVQREIEQRQIADTTFRPQPVSDQRNLWRTMPAFDLLCDPCSTEARCCHPVVPSGYDLGRKRLRTRCLHRDPLGDPLFLAVNPYQGEVGRRKLLARARHRQPELSSLLTRRWRGVDSNFRFRDALSSPTARPWSRRLIRR